MKLFHLSDLHLGKNLNGFSMCEDQVYILNVILQMIAEEAPQGVIIAGDVYDKPVPPAEAVEIFDSFLVRLAEMKIPAFIISGNHDSPERLAFGSRLIDHSGIHLAPVYHGTIQPLRLCDRFGAVNLYMLPFIKPVHVRQCFPEKEISSYTDAVRAAIEEMHLNFAERNVLIAHQFVTGASRSDSETVSVGGTDNVDGSVMDCFDYAALGHIHGPQNVGSEKLRYCGTPLKYSFSESQHQKSVTVVELEEKGNLKVRTLPLTPLHDMKEIRGTFNELTTPRFYENTSLQNDYLHITLTDEQDIPDVQARLRSIYPRIMKLDYDNSRTRSTALLNVTEADMQQKSPLELFEDFYEQQNGMKMSEEQVDFVSKLIESIWEGLS